MDVSNSTGEDTQYRTGSGTTKIAAGWKSLPVHTNRHSPDLTAPWTISFKLPDGTVLSATYKEPKESVALVKNGSHYSITAVKKTVKKPVKAAKTKNAA